MSYLKSLHHLIRFTSISDVFDIDNVVYCSAQVIWELTQFFNAFQLFKLPLRFTVQVTQISHSCQTIFMPTLKCMYAIKKTFGVWNSAPLDSLYAHVIVATTVSNNMHIFYNC
jgi:hypothetical protein